MKSTGDAGAEDQAQPSSLDVGQQGEAAASAQRAVLQYVVDNIPSLIFWKDRNSIYLGCNRSFAALDGKADPAALVGRTDHDMTWRALADSYRAGDREVMERGEPVINKEEVSPDGKGGEMVILTSKVPMRNAAGDIMGILGIIHDITDRKRMELDLQRAKEQAEEAARLRSRFIANVSHELRTPLTLILGPIGAALAEDAAQPSLPAPTRATLECVQRNAARLLNLVNDVLDFSKTESGSIKVSAEPVDVQRHLHTVVDDMQPLAAARGLTLHCEVSGDAGDALLDAHLVERIVLNLVGNALKFTPSGRRVDVRVTTSLARAADAPGALQITVKDDGIGISDDLQQRLFRPFVQGDASTTRRYEGTGLGLALVKQIATALGGDVHVESRLGQGSTFTVRLPLPAAAVGSHARAHAAGEGPTGGTDADAAAARRVRIAAEAAAVPAAAERVDDAPRGAAAAAAEEAPSPLDAVRVLVADDNADMARYIAATLGADKRMRIAVVADGLSAWQQLHSGHFDLVVSDVMMPELSGVELACRMKAHPTLRDVPIILVSAAAGECVAGGLDDGADDYIVKPFAPAELRARVRAALRTRALQRELRLAQKLESLGQLAAGIAHEINTPVQFIALNVDYFKDAFARIEALRPRLLGDGGAATAARQELVAWLAETERAMPEAIDATEEGVARISSIVRAMNEFSHTSDTVVPIDVNRALELSLEIARHEYNLVADIDKQLGAVPLVDGKAGELNQVFLNLIVNAAHAIADAEGRRETGERGTITVRSAVDDDGGLIVSVEDTGTGIDPAIRERVFDPFFTTKAVGRGTGQGLAIARAAVQRHGGSLTFESEVGRGTRFIVRLPARVAATELAAAE